MGSVQTSAATVSVRGHACLQEYRTPASPLVLGFPASALQH